MKSNVHKIVIVGAGEFAEIAYEYFTYDSEYEVTAFCVEREYQTSDSLKGLPVIAFEDIEKLYPPEEFGVFVAITYTKLNRARTRLFQAAKSKGYKPVSYISSHAFVWRNVEIGENCFIFENNVLQYGVKLGDNIIMWSGNHIGHQTVIESNCFISSHVVVSGYCKIESNCFLGVNSSIADYKIIKQDCFLAAGTVISKNTEPNQIYRGNPAKPAVITSLMYFGMEE